MKREAPQDRPTDEKVTQKPIFWGRISPLLILAFGVFAVYHYELHTYLTLDMLRQQRGAIAAYVAEHYALSLLVYAGLYIGVVAFSLPGASLMTLAGGFFFGSLAGTVAAVCSATIGATIIFLATRFALADYFRQKATGFIERMRHGFKDNAFNYLLFLRLVPLFPFFMVNVVPGVLGVRLRDFVGATFIGIIPGAYVYASVGTGIGSVLDSSGPISLHTILTPEVIIALVGLGCLALLPIVVKRFKRKPEE